jgi:hypothetical protein
MNITKSLYRINLFYLIQKIKTQVEQTTGDKITCNLKNEDQSSQKRPQRNVEHDSKQRNKLPSQIMTLVLFSTPI